MALNLNTRAVGLAESIDDIVNRVNRRGLNVKINASSYTQPLGRITQQADEFNKSIEASNARVLAFGASAAIIGAVATAFSELVGQAIKFEKILTDINVVLGASQETLQKFGDGLFNVARNTSQALDTAAEAALEFSRQGLTMEETLQRTNDALILTRLTGIGAAEAVSGLTAAVNGFADAGLNTTQIINKLAAVDVQFAVSAEDLINALARAGAVAQDAGVSFDQLVGAVTSAQQITARGGAVIGNSFKTIFTRIQRSSTLDRLEELGIAVRDLQGNTLPALTVLTNLSKTYDQLGASTKAAVAEQVGGVFQINILRAALKDLSRETSLYSRATEISSNATDQAQQKNAQLQQTIASLATQTSLSVQELSANIGELALSPGIRRILDAVKSFSESINNVLGDDSEGIGADFAKGLIKGIGGVLTGPGLAVAFAVFFKLFYNASKFAASSLKDILGIVTAKDKERVLQEAIVQAMQENKYLAMELGKFANDKGAQEKIILGVIKQQTEFLERQKAIASSLAPVLRQAGVRPDLTMPTSRPGPASTTRSVNSSGFIPNYSSVSEFEKQTEKEGARKGGYTPGTIAKMDINGLGTVIYNTAEQVKQFPGMSQQAIMPPQSSKAGMNYKKDFKKKHGFDPYQSDGFVPNFIDPRSRGQKIRDVLSDPANKGIKFKNKKYASVKDLKLKSKSDERFVEIYIKSPGQGDLFIDRLRKVRGYNESELEKIKELKRAYQSGSPVSLNGNTINSEGFIPNFAQSFSGLSAQDTNQPAFVPKGTNILQLPPAKMITETNVKDFKRNKKTGWHNMEAPIASVSQHMTTYKDEMSDLQKAGVNVLRRQMYFSSYDNPRTKQEIKTSAEAETSKFARTKRGPRAPSKKAVGDQYEKSLHKKYLEPLGYKQTHDQAKIDFIGKDKMPIESKFNKIEQANLIAKSIRLYGDKGIRNFLRTKGFTKSAQSINNKNFQDSLQILKSSGINVDNLSLKEQVKLVKRYQLHDGFIPNFDATSTETFRPTTVSRAEEYKTTIEKFMKENERQGQKTYTMRMLSDYMSNKGGLTGVSDGALSINIMGSKDATGQQSKIYTYLKNKYSALLSKFNRNVTPLTKNNHQLGGSYESLISQEFGAVQAGHMAPIDFPKGLQKNVEKFKNLKSINGATDPLSLQKWSLLSTTKQGDPIEAMATAGHSKRHMGDKGARFAASHNAEKVAQIISSSAKNGAKQQVDLSGYTPGDIVELVQSGKDETNLRGISVPFYKVLTTPRTQAKDRNKQLQLLKNRSTTRATKAQREKNFTGPEAQLINIDLFGGMGSSKQIIGKDKILQVEQKVEKNLNQAYNQLNNKKSQQNFIKNLRAGGASSFQLTYNKDQLSLSDHPYVKNKVSAFEGLIPNFAGPYKFRNSPNVRVKRDYIWKPDGTKDWYTQLGGTSRHMNEFVKWLEKNKKLPPKQMETLKSQFTKNKETYEKSYWDDYNNIQSGTAGGASRRNFYGTSVSSARPLPGDEKTQLNITDQKTKLFIKKDKMENLIKEWKQANPFVNQGLIPNFAQLSLYRGQTKSRPNLDKPNIGKNLPSFKDVKTPEDAVKVIQNFVKSHVSGNFSGQRSKGGISSGATSFSTSPTVAKNFAGSIEIGKPVTQGHVLSKTVPEKNVFDKAKILKILKKGSDPKTGYYPKVEEFKKAMSDGTIQKWAEKNGGLYLNVHGSRNDPALLKYYKTEYGRKEYDFYDKSMRQMVPHADVGKTPRGTYEISPREKEVMQVFNQGFIPNFIPQHLRQNLSKKWLNARKIADPKSAISLYTGQASSYMKMNPNQYMQVKGVPKDGMPVTTKMADGTVETKNKAYNGDYIISGVKGEKWVVNKSDFKSKYNIQKDGSILPKGDIRQVGIVNADDLYDPKTKSSTISFNAPWGGKMEVRPKDAIVNDPDGAYRVDRSAFDKTYKFVHAGLIPNYSAAINIAKTGGLVSRGVSSQKTRKEISSLIKQDPYLSTLLGSGVGQKLSWDQFSRQDKLKLNSFLLKQGITKRTLEGYGFLSFNSTKIAGGAKDLLTHNGLIPNFTEKYSDPDISTPSKIDSGLNNSSGFVPNYSFLSTMRSIPSKAKSFFTQKFDNFNQVWKTLQNPRNRQKYLVDQGLIDKSEALRIAKLPPKEAFKEIKQRQASMDDAKFDRNLKNYLGRVVSPTRGDWITGTRDRGLRQEINAINKLRTSSQGLIPNYANPLEQSISREITAGVPRSIIRIDQDNSLKSRENPGGLAVINTRDEPGGIKQGIQRAKKMGIDPKTHGASAGFVPNYSFGAMTKAGKAAYNSASRPAHTPIGPASEKAAKSVEKLGDKSAGAADTSGGLMMGMFALTSATYAVEGAMGDAETMTAKYVKSINAGVMGLSQSVLIYQGLNSVGDSLMKSQKKGSQVMGRAVKGIGMFGGVLALAIPLITALRENFETFQTSAEIGAKRMQKLGKEMETLQDTTSLLQKEEKLKSDIITLQNSANKNSFSTQMKLIKSQTDLYNTSMQLESKFLEIAKMDLTPEQREKFEKGSTQEKIQVGQEASRDKSLLNMFSNSVAGIRANVQVEGSKDISLDSFNAERLAERMFSPDVFSTKSQKMLDDEYAFTRSIRANSFDTLEETSLQTGSNAGVSQKNINAAREGVNRLGQNLAGQLVSNNIDVESTIGDLNSAIKDYINIYRESSSLDINLGTEEWKKTQKDLVNKLRETNPVVGALYQSFVDQGISANLAQAMTNKLVGGLKDQVGENKKQNAVQSATTLLNNKLRDEMAKTLSNLSVISNQYDLQSKLTSENNQLASEEVKLRQQMLARIGLVSSETQTRNDYDNELKSIEDKYVQDKNKLYKKEIEQSSQNMQKAIKESNTASGPAFSNLNNVTLLPKMDTFKDMKVNNSLTGKNNKQLPEPNDQPVPRREGETQADANFRFNRDSLTQKLDNKFEKEGSTAINLYIGALKDAKNHVDAQAITLKFLNEQVTQADLDGAYKDMSAEVAHGTKNMAIIGALIEYGVITNKEVINNYQKQKKILNDNLKSLNDSKNNQEKEAQINKAFADIKAGNLSGVKALKNLMDEQQNYGERLVQTELDSLNGRIGMLQVDQMIRDTKDRELNAAGKTAAAQELLAAKITEQALNVDKALDAESDRLKDSRNANTAKKGSMNLQSKRAKNLDASNLNEIDDAYFRIQDMMHQSGMTYGPSGKIQRLNNPNRGKYAKDTRETVDMLDAQGNQVIGQDGKAVQVPNPTFGMDSFDMTAQQQLADLTSSASDLAEQFARNRAAGVHAQETMNKMDEEGRAYIKTLEDIQLRLKEKDFATKGKQSSVTGSGTAAGLLQANKAKTERLSSEDLANANKNLASTGYSVAEDATYYDLDATNRKATIDGEITAIKNQTAAYKKNGTFVNESMLGIVRANNAYESTIADLQNKLEKDQFGKEALQGIEKQGYSLRGETQAIEAKSRVINNPESQFQGKTGFEAEASIDTGKITNRIKELDGQFERNVKAGKYQEEATLNVNQSLHDMKESQERFIEALKRNQPELDAMGEMGEEARAFIYDMRKLRKKLNSNHFGNMGYMEASNQRNQIAKTTQYETGRQEYYASQGNSLKVAETEAEIMKARKLSNEEISKELLFRDTLNVRIAESNAQLERFGETLANTSYDALEQGLKQLVDDFGDASKTKGEALLAFAGGIARKIADAFLDAQIAKLTNSLMTLTNSLTGGGGSGGSGDQLNKGGLVGYNKGGAVGINSQSVARYNKGSMVSSKDIPQRRSFSENNKVPAMLTSGEYVVRKKIVDRLGASSFDSFNQSGNLEELFDKPNFETEEISTENSAILPPVPSVASSMMDSNLIKSSLLKPKAENSIKENIPTFKDGGLADTPINKLLSLFSGQLSKKLNPTVSNSTDHPNIYKNSKDDTSVNFDKKYSNIISQISSLQNKNSNQSPLAQTTSNITNINRSPSSSTSSNNTISSFNDQSRRTISTLQSSIGSYFGKAKEKQYPQSNTYNYNSSSQSNEVSDNSSSTYPEIKIPQNHKNPSIVNTSSINNMSTSNISNIQKINRDRRSRTQATNLKPSVVSNTTDNYNQSKNISSQSSYINNMPKNLHESRYSELSNKYTNIENSSSKIYKNSQKDTQNISSIQESSHSNYFNNSPASSQSYINNVSNSQTLKRDQRSPVSQNQKPQAISTPSSYFNNSPVSSQSYIKNISNLQTLSRDQRSPVSKNQKTTPPPSLYNYSHYNSVSSSSNQTSSNQFTNNKFNNSTISKSSNQKSPSLNQTRRRSNTPSITNNVSTTQKVEKPYSYSNINKNFNNTPYSYFNDGGVVENYSNSKDNRQYNNYPMSKDNQPKYIKPVSTNIKSDYFNNSESFFSNSVNSSNIKNIQQPSPVNQRRSRQQSIATILNESNVNKNSNTINQGSNFNYSSDKLDVTSIEDLTQDFNLQNVPKFNLGGAARGAAMSASYIAGSSVYRYNNRDPQPYGGPTAPEDTLKRLNTRTSLDINPRSRQMSAHFRKNDSYSSKYGQYLLDKYQYDVEQKNAKEREKSEMIGGIFTSLVGGAAANVTSKFIDSASAAWEMREAMPEAYDVATGKQTRSEAFGKYDKGLKQDVWANPDMANNMSIIQDRFSKRGIDVNNLTEMNQYNSAYGRSMNQARNLSKKRAAKAAGTEYTPETLNTTLRKYTPKSRRKAQPNFNFSEAFDSQSFSSPSSPSSGDTFNYSNVYNMRAGASGMNSQQSIVNSQSLNPYIQPSSSGLPKQDLGSLMKTSGNPGSPNFSYTTSASAKGTSINPIQTQPSQNYRSPTIYNNSNRNTSFNNTSNSNRSQNQIIDNGISFPKFDLSSFMGSGPTQCSLDGTCMSNGGKVYGPNGVDKVGPVLLDRGEYVVKASTVNSVEKQYPGFFDRLNSMQMNQGGSVTAKAPEPTAAMTPTKTTNEKGNAGNVTVNINVASDGSTSIQGGEASQQQFGSKIKEAVLGVIAQEKRVGGMLSGR